ncbi:splicing factor Cactin isoform X2 [Oenanthe melanoleuca]|uniref:splicing factor Cactin isoform X2 n=1 Tax=Oenanthe melanoleuca TaxID=2939378 RepID=UPI0024C1ADF8|nr:splicing factor Cactin isoform X2 [Oenanthe melanoleuca]
MDKEKARAEASWLTSEGFFLSMSTCTKSVLVAVPLPTHVCPGGCPCPHACPGGCCCSHTCPCPCCACTVCRMYGGGGAAAAAGRGADGGVLSRLCVGGSRPGRFSFLGCFEGFPPPSPGSPFSRDLYPALIKRSAVCAVLSGLSASCVGALGKRGAGRDGRKRLRSAPGAGLPRRPPVCAGAAGAAGRVQADGGAAWCAEAPRGPGAEPPLPMGSESRSPARGGRSERERDRDKERDRDRDRERERDRGRSRSGSRGRRHRSRSKSRSRGRRREPSSGSDSGDERHKWKKKKRSSSRDRHRKERRKRRSRSRGRSSGSSPECGRDRAARSRERRRRRDGSKSSVSSVSSPSPPRPRGREEPGQQLSLQERLRLREEKKKQAALLKALETPEEKRARRLAKKEAKERKKREKMGWGEEYMGYTNTDNPFGDNNLLGTFIWSKALEKKGISHLDEKDLKERNKRIQEDNRLELQKVKQLRLEREREKAMREQELEMLQREKEAEHFKTWEEQEDNFHLQQAKLRSKIRIRDGRAKPIDLLAKYISAEDDDLAVEMHEPYTFLNGLTVSDMEDLVEDIQVYMELEQGKNVDFWRDMTIITEDEIAKLRKLEASGKGGPGERRDGVNASVSSDVQSVFKGKTYNQLQALYQGIESKIRAGGPNLDIGYWESLLQQLKAYMARARLRERHQDVLRQKLYKLKQEQGVESEPLFPIIKREPASPSDRLDPEESLEAQPGPSSEPEAEQDTEAKGEAEGEAVLMEEDLIQQSLDDYDAGKYSPRLLGPNELPFDAHVLEAEEDMHRLLLLRQQLQVTGDASESTDDIFFRKAKEGMGADEAQFSVEMPLTGKAYLWADKYRPRKPRFFNRVHTGFEWNKYNQTHYDFDNPPPKIVQGYKFNIFYPDLIDKRSTPEYFLEACQDNKDFAILRFHAGPPYEDIAFKIVNREWEYSHRHGFRCQFANGIFQLWFHFKRYRYRR